ncbi:ALF repeat-containing protein [Streptomyces sp. NPDC059991]|uniref:ALF repeat-containing protein n=1 Tax=Streptomyces sp. NPDC059991 TaxID=3347028 RepID=UPI0036C669F1
MAGVLGSESAKAAESVAAETVPGAITPTARGQVLELWKTGGTGMKATAEAALLGSDSEVNHFLEQVKDK